MSRAGVERASAGSRRQRPDGVVILGVDFDRVSREAALTAMTRAFGRGGALKIYIVNAHTLNVACSDASFKQVLNGADFLFNDGTGVQLASRLAGKPFLDNLVGTDLVPQLCERAAQVGTSVFLLGGRPGVPETAAEGLRARVPGLRIAGVHQGYFSEDDNGRVVEAINASGAGILLVAFGNPLQEMWIHRNAPALRCDLCIGIGGLIDHLSGRLRRAPLWMRRLGIEWMHILAGQPHKWRRYLLGNPLFVARVTAEFLGSRTTPDRSAWRPDREK
jgi:N-acetylglucosaminyldiphosphoundecaprenol N-acetyl-beta-D-mannosaminyltransferase